jgi:hypothetical protein
MFLNLIRFFQILIIQEYKDLVKALMQQEMILFQSLQKQCIPGTELLAVCIIL